MSLGPSGCDEHSERSRFSKSVALERNQPTKGGMGDGIFNAADLEAKTGGETTFLFAETKARA